MQLLSAAPPQGWAFGDLVLSNVDVGEDVLTFTVQEVASRCVVRVAGEIDLATSASLGQCLEALDGVVVVDLAEVTFIDSSGLSLLIRERKRLRARSADLQVRTPHDHVRRVFEVTGLSALLADGSELEDRWGRQ